MWLRKTAYDRLSGVRRDHVKAARCTINRESQSPDQSSIMIANQLTVSSPSPSGEAAKQELVKILQHAVWQLDDIDREILLMRYEEKLSNREVAYLLEISPDAASKRHGRALLRLQTVLLENGFSESKL
jgi:RNA polymerase sigma-70 factor (ECF subfamily)